MLSNWPGLDLTGLTGLTSSYGPGCNEYYKGNTYVAMYAIRNVKAVVMKHMNPN